MDTLDITDDELCRLFDVTARLVDGKWRVFADTFYPRTVSEVPWSDTHAQAQQMAVQYLSLADLYYIGAHENMDDEDAFDGPD